MTLTNERASNRTSVELKDVKRTPFHRPTTTSNRTSVELKGTDADGVWKGFIDF